MAKLHASITNENGTMVAKTGNESLRIELRHGNKLVHALTFKVEQGTGGHNWEIVDTPPYKPIERIRKCPKCGCEMTELNDCWVCDNESCGYNIEKKEQNKGKQQQGETRKCADGKHYHAEGEDYAHCYMSM